MKSLLAALTLALFIQTANAADTCRYFLQVKSITLHEDPRTILNSSLIPISFTISLNYVIQPWLQDFQVSYPESKIGEAVQINSAATTEIPAELAATDIQLYATVDDRSDNLFKQIADINQMINLKNTFANKAANSSLSNIITLNKEKNFIAVSNLNSKLIYLHSKSNIDLEIALINGCDAQAATSFKNASVLK